MEAFISHFTFLSDQALQDNDFDPSTMEDLMKLFEIESYKAWACVELDEHEKEVEEAQVTIQQQEEHYLDSVIESSMLEFWHFEDDLDWMSKAEIDSLVETAESDRKMENAAASVASNTYIEAAVNLATASIKSAWEGLSSAKVHSS